MKLIEQHNVHDLFHPSLLQNVTVIRRSDQEWYFTFQARTFGKRALETYTLKTQRGHLKIWTRPQTLFSFLLSYYGITQGKFKLIEEAHHASLV